MNATILVVDDEPNVVRSLTRALQPVGFEVLQAESGYEALEKLQEHNVHLVISDMRMPGMDGAELLGHIAASYRHIRRIILTGYASIERAIAAINEGNVNRYLTKPWDNEELRNVVMEELELGRDSLRKENAYARLKEKEEALKQKLEISAGLLTQSSEILKASSIDSIADSFRTLAQYQLPERLELSDEVLKIISIASRHAGLSADERQDLIDAAKVHRIGELALPAEVVSKCFFDHSAAESEMYRAYPEITCNILQGCNPRVIDIVAHHREHNSIDLSPSAALLKVVTEYTELMFYRGQTPEGRQKIVTYMQNCTDTRYPRETLETVLKVTGAES